MSKIVVPIKIKADRKTIAKRGCDSWVVSHATERDTREAA